MGSVERIQNVAKRVAKWMKAGHQVVVVPSAMSGETNRLLGLAKEINPNPDPRELDQIASTGEQVSSGLLALALQAQGVGAVSYAGWQVTIKTNSAYTKAFEAAGLVLSGRNPETSLVEIVELPTHPFFIGVQYHPELKSTVESPAPLFVHFVAAARQFSEKNSIQKSGSVSQSELV